MNSDSCKILICRVRDDINLSLILKYQVCEIPFDQVSSFNQFDYFAVYSDKLYQNKPIGIILYGKVQSLKLLKSISQDGCQDFLRVEVVGWQNFSGDYILSEGKDFSLEQLDDIQNKGNFYKSTSDSKSEEKDLCLQTLIKYYGYSEFRFGQREIIDAILQKKDVLGVMPTGAGKSICYQIPALLSSGVTLVISPLISLMQDQVQALVAMGIRGAYINSSLNDRQIVKVLDLAAKETYKIIYVAPERLLTRLFLDCVAKITISMIAVDEAHCISQWGQDFRPAYLQIPEFLHRLSYRPVMAAFTATATEHVQEDIVNILGLHQPKVLITSFDRKNLFFAVYQMKPKEKGNFILNYVRQHCNESGIIYCSTRKNVEKITQLLNDASVSAVAYHAGMDVILRKKNQEDFLNDRVGIVVATNAFGMGIDKSNVRYVIHHGMPQCMENYYQEAGRAGRDGLPAECLLLFSKSDIVTNRYFLNNKEYVGVDLNLIPELRRRDESKLQVMIRYAQGNSCLRNIILQYFGEKREENCHNCGYCIPSKIEIVLSEKEKISVTKSDKFVLSDDDNILFEMLRKQRMEIANKKRVPPFVIFSDATLRDMVRRCPLTYKELLEVYGVGENKLRMFGPEFLSVILNWKKSREVQS